MVEPELVEAEAEPEAVEGNEAADSDRTEQPSETLAPNTEVKDGEAARRIFALARSSTSLQGKRLMSERGVWRRRRFVLATPRHLRT